MIKKNKIFVFGMGYVGASLAYLLSKENIVYCYDIDKSKIDLIKKNVAPIPDEDISNYINANDLNLNAAEELPETFDELDYIIIATPTDYDNEKESFITDTITKIISNISKNTESANIVIKSTVPIGYTIDLQNKFTNLNILHSPEFLREGKALYDNQHPSRIIVGHNNSHESAVSFANVLKSLSNEEDTKVLIVSSCESESIKLFSNSYLAMRVSFFNELDSFAISKDLSTRNIIDGVCMDKRIGMEYNNPSFGYGGYCLPKDTKQLLSSFDTVPQSIISATVESNLKRKDFLIQSIIDLNPSDVGVYRLVMKKGSENFKESSILKVADGLHKKGIKIRIYEPLIDNNDLFPEYELYNDFKKFDEDCDLYVTVMIDTFMKPKYFKSLGRFFEIS